MTHDIVKDESFLNDHNKVLFVDDINQIYSGADIISLHIPHNTTTERIINTQVIEEKLKKNPIIINTSRGMLIDTEAMIAGLKKGKVRGYLTDVLITEPMTHDEKLKGLDNVIITPHIGSRTYQSVERQGLMAVKNLIKLIEVEDKSTWHTCLSSRTGFFLSVLKWTGLLRHSLDFSSLHF